MAGAKGGNPNWVKGGRSPNPSGRPKTAEVFRDRCRAFADGEVIAAWQQEVLERGPNWLEASRLLAAYGHGKPVQPVESKVDVTISDERQMTTAQLDAKIAELESHVEH